MCVYEDQVLIFARRFWCTNSGDTVVHEYLGGNIRFILGEQNFSTSIGVCFEPQITSCALAFIVKHTFYIWTIGLYQQQYSSIVFTIHSHSEFATACILSIWSYGKTILYFFLGEHAWQWGKWWVIKTLWETWVIKTLWETSAPRRTHHKLMLTIIGSFVFLMCLKLFSLPSMARLILSTLQHAMGPTLKCVMETVKILH